MLCPHLQLSRAMFPLGPLIKAEVRQMARAAGLATQGRKDSQGVMLLLLTTSPSLPLLMMRGIAPGLMYHTLLSPLSTNLCPAMPQGSAF